MEKRPYVTRVGYGSKIDSRTNLLAGVTIAPGVIVGYQSNVVADICEEHGIYINKPHPWATLQRKIEIDDT